MLNHSEHSSIYITLTKEREEIIHPLFFLPNLILGKKIKSLFYYQLYFMWDMWRHVGLYGY